MNRRRRRPEQIRTGAFKPRGVQLEESAVTSLRKAGALQQPALFDFARRRGDPVLLVIR